MTNRESISVAKAPHTLLAGSTEIRMELNCKLSSWCLAVTVLDGIIHTIGEVLPPTVFPNFACGTIDLSSEMHPLVNG